MSDPTQNNTGAPTVPPAAPPAAPPAMLTQPENTGVLTQDSAAVFQTPQPANGAPTIIQDTPNEYGKRNLFPTDGSPAIEVKPLSKRKKKFNVKTPQKDDEPSTNTIRLVKVVTTGTNPLTGLIMIPTSPYMDKHLINVMRLKGDNPVYILFHNCTSTVHWTFTCKDQFGNEIAKQGTDGKLYGIRGCFMSLEVEAFDTDEKIRDIVNNNFGPALWNSIDKVTYKLAKPSDRPHLEPNFSDVVHEVSNWSDVFMSQSDIFSVARQACKMEGISFKDWLADDPDNLYTLVKRGKLEPAVAKQFYIPFHMLSQEDKVAYQAYDNRLKAAATAATPRK